jgi:hypothetical protein
MIRAMREEDLQLIQEVHKEFYSRDFPIPDFQKHFLCAFVAVNEKQEIVSAGGVRTICESILITDKRQPVATRREALYDMLSASMYIAGKNNYNALHAFIQEAGWKSHLEKVGFTPITGDGLIIQF